MKIPKHGQTLGQLQKMCRLSDVEFKCCQKDGEKWWLTMDKTFRNMIFNHF